MQYIERQRWVGRRRTHVVALGLLRVAALWVCLTQSGVAVAQERSIRQELVASLAKFHEQDDSLAAELKTASGYALFPGIGKFGIGLGGARGSGQVIVKGAAVADATLTQASVGFQLGAQKYAELILFQTPEALETFLAGKFTFSAQASAVAIKSGASANAKYTDGVKVMTLAGGGLMYEASVGGQKFGIKKY